MSYCINPRCPNPLDPENANNATCRHCGSQMLLQGRYTVVEKLGQGGFGTTFEVSDRSGKRKVLKILTDENSKAIELFQQEAQVLNQLQSPGIPQVDADGYFTVKPNNSSAPLHCLVMEKIEGVDLEKWMKSRHCQPISQIQAFDWLKQLVNILSIIHDQQYFHRDIKPQNIMLRPNGQLVLIDFGAVRQVTTTILDGVSHTRIVSKGYSPPEQQNGYSVQQSDFFALGRTFVFLLTGKEPQDLDIYNPLTNELDWRPHALQISPVFADLIDYLMAATASNRPENTQVIWQFLEKIKPDVSQTNILSQRTLLQKFPNSALSFATTVFSHSAHQQHKARKIIIGSGVSLFAAATVILNPLSTTNPVTTTKADFLKTPIANSSTVPIVIQKEQQPNTKITKARNINLSSVSIPKNTKNTQLKPEKLQSNQHPIQKHIAAGENESSIDAPKDNVSDINLHAADRARKDIKNSLLKTQPRRHPLLNNQRKTSKIFVNKKSKWRKENSIKIKKQQKTIKILSSSATKNKRLTNKLRYDIKVKIKSHQQNKKH
ncbi:serine/threonine protein kinase [Pelatocladus sp. BLCC-F211]|uniref:serine/threonine protein kinase n=1 Tax=Pelatocladus sp. BLCC-F211 TaxID=3342752 RepID=UPI0035BA0CBE